MKHFPQESQMSHGSVNYYISHLRVRDDIVVSVANCMLILIYDIPFGSCGFRMCGRWKKIMQKSNTEFGAPNWVSFDTLPFEEDWQSTDNFLTCLFIQCSLLSVFYSRCLGMNLIFLLLTVFTVICCRYCVRSCVTLLHNEQSMSCIPASVDGRIGRIHYNSCHMVHKMAMLK